MSNYFWPWDRLPDNNPTTWVPGSDDQAYLFDWSIRTGTRMILETSKVVRNERGASHSVPQKINNFKPFDYDLHELVRLLKEKEAA